MKINLQHSNQYQNFSGRNLFCTALPLAKGKEKISCFVTEMAQDDIFYFEQYQELFKNNSFAAGIVQDFLKKTKENMKTGLTPFRERFLMVEEVASKSDALRVKALAKFEIAENSDDVHLKRIVSFKNKHLGVSGAAVCILYTLSKYAQEFCRDKISLIANNSAFEFYKNAGFILENKGIKSCFYLPQKKFLKFQNDLEKRFGIVKVKTSS